MVIQTARKSRGGKAPRMQLASRLTALPVPTRWSGPKSLLNTNKSNPRTVDIEHANSANSPLLRLPSEIRNRIYEHILGVNILHVGSVLEERGTNGTRILPKTVCRTTGHGHDATKAMREAEEVNELSDPFTIGHAGCLLSNNFSGFHTLLNLLVVSRQIHNEAALLPYQLNTFYFNSIQSLRIFVEALGQDQREAIQNMGLLITSERDWRLQAYNPFYGMRSVRDLSIFVQLPYENALGYKPWHDQKGLGFWLFDEIKKVMDLQTVSVTICPMESAYFTAGTVAELKQWSIRVENKLLAGGKGKHKRAGPKKRPCKKRKIDWIGSLSKRSL